MSKYFWIELIARKSNRIPVSYKLKEYLEDFILAHVLVPKKLVGEGKWIMDLGFLLGEDSEVLPKIKIGHTYTSSREKTKSTTIMISYVDSIRSSANPLKTTIETFWEAITVFLTKKYKSIKREQLDELYKKLDMHYLLSLPYPAPLEEQRYGGDLAMPDGSIYIQDID